MKFLEIVKESKRLKIMLTLSIISVIITIASIALLCLGIIPSDAVFVPLYLIISSLAVIFVLFILSYNLRCIIVRKTNDNIEVTLITRIIDTRINVKDFSVVNVRDVLKWRVLGTQIGNKMYGLFKGPIGYVEVFATNDKGILLVPREGKLKYLIAIKGIDKVLDCILDVKCNYKEISVR